MFNIEPKDAGSVGKPPPEGARSGAPRLRAGAEPRLRAGAEWKRSSRPDRRRVFGHCTVEFFGIGGGAVRRFTLQPGWRWTLDMGPAAATKWCEAFHFQYQVSGRLHVQMSDGTGFELGPGDLSLVPGGHDTWVVGDQPVILVDWYRASNLTTIHGAMTR